MGPVSALGWAPIIAFAVVLVSVGIAWAWPHLVNWFDGRRQQRLAVELAEKQRQLWLAEQALSHELRAHGLEARKSLIRESLAYGRDQAQGTRYVERRPR